MSKEAMKLAMSWIHANGEHDQLCDILDLDDYGKHKPCSCGLSRVQSALRKALAEQPAQEPICGDDDDVCVDCGMEHCECGEKDD